MQSSMAETHSPAPRYPLLDEMRGLALVSMMGYHAMWDLVYLFGVYAPWYGGMPGFLWQQATSWCFILLSGFCLRLGHHPIRRGLVVFAAGALVGLAALVLTASGNPGNMGICVVCFNRDIAGAVGLHRAPIVQYLRPEIMGMVLGSLAAALCFGEYRARGGSAPAVRFLLGVIAAIGALVFLGCPWRVIMRLAGGDGNDAVLTSLGFAGLVWAARLSPGRADGAEADDGHALLDHVELRQRLTPETLAALRKTLADQGYRPWQAEFPGMDLNFMEMSEIPQDRQTEILENAVSLLMASEKGEGSLMLAPAAMLPAPAGGSGAPRNRMRPLARSVSTALTVVEPMSRPRVTYFMISFMAIPIYNTLFCGIIRTERPARFVTAAKAVRYHTEYHGNVNISIYN